MNGYCRDFSKSALVILNHKLRTFKNIKFFKNAINYFNDPKKADMNLLNMESEKNEKYFIRNGSTGAFDSNGDKSMNMMIDEFERDKPTKIWTNFISVRKDDAKKLGLLTKKDYASYTERIVMYMAKELNISISNLVWSGFYHIDTPTHDNVHFYLYDKSNPHSTKLLTKDQIYTLKSKAINDIVNRNPLFEMKEQAKQTLQQKVSETLQNNHEHLLTWKCVLPREYQSNFMKLVTELPATGRLSYNSYAMKEYQPLLNECIKTILNTGDNKKLWIQYRNILDDAIDSNKTLYGSVHGKKHEDYRVDQLNRLYSVIGNAILHEVKQYRMNAIVTKSFPKDRHKEALYVNRRLKKYHSMKSMVSGKRILLGKINTYYSDRTRNELERAAQQEIQKEMESEMEKE